MERCPNCGTPGRPGAKFCTTCGYRFPDESNTNDVDVVGAGPIAPNNDGETGSIAAEPKAGWPSPSAPAEVFPGDWDQQTALPSPATSASGEETIDIEAVSTSWPDEPVDAWPTPPAAVFANPVPSEPGSNEDTERELESASAVDFDAQAANHTETAEATARANRLLDELRDTIAAIGPNSTIDLSGVISDLEVAVTPPGAMAADDVAELREALLAARERPRDVDTIVDLTKRVDAMVALVIAYDRTIAAIERSLDALRG